MNNELFLRQNSSIPIKYSFVAGIHPPPPRTGSIITAAKSFFIDFKTLIEFSKSLYGNETICFSSVSPPLSDFRNGQFIVLSKSVV